MAEKKKKKAKKVNKCSDHISHGVKDFLAFFAFNVVAILIASFGLKGFILPNSFIDGGTTGISILLSMIFDLPVSIFLIIVNLPFVIAAWIFVGKKTSIYTFISIIGLALAVKFVHFPIVTDDKLLSAVFGGIFLGAGIGLAVRGQSTLDGTEIMALIISRKTAFTIGNMITLFNVFIFSTGLLVIGTEACLYSMLTYISASKAVDYLIYGFEEYYGVHIHSPHYDKIKQAIYSSMERGVTIYDTEGGYKQEKSKALYCVITKLETSKIKSILNEIDCNAFVTYHLLKDAQGGLTRKRIMKIHT